MSGYLEFGILLMLIIVAGMLWSMRHGRTYLGIPKQFDANTEVTTSLPVPAHAALCDHDWDVLKDETLEMEHEKKTVLVLVCKRCGIIDKTIQKTSPKPPYSPEPCLHEWQTAVEQSLEMAHEKKVVIVMTCRKCGDVDKTTEVTSKAPPIVPSKAECRHKWETEKRVMLDSAYEQMLKSITVKTYGKGKVDPDKKIELDLNEAPAWKFRKVYICIRICTLCGEIDKTIASNFEIDAEEEVDNEPINLKNELLRQR